MAQNAPQDETYACDLHDPSNDALTRLPIPPLLADLSNYYAWQHALYFHLRYHGIFYFLTGHEQSRWDLRWHEAEGNEASRPTYFDRRNYMRRNMHAYSILFSKIGSVVPRLLEAGWDGDHDSFGFRTDLLWNRIQALRQRRPGVPAQQPGREQHQDNVQAQGRMVNGVNGHMVNGIHPSQAIDLEDDDEME
ncbi:hypothetical protein QBC32DRAFT_209340 [Pseudoneurospora amorphoporcata]|uniref:Uncharacterized protein n=1 Tax=Pseudoneurospora amorphoporcata TaxID=241081 RepID=A0AAN6NX92_9PEZI|nr:hypothetical protein QBC32DRAFT_209340 [Pseudoneurospora amorphoporcata]